MLQVNKAPLSSASRADSQKISYLYKTRSLAAVFTRSRQWTLFWARWIHSTSSHRIYFTSILILSSCLLAGIPSECLSDFMTKTLFAFIVSHACYVSRRSHPLHFVVCLILGEEYKLRRSSLCNFLQSPFTIQSVIVAYLFPQAVSKIAAVLLCLQVMSIPLCLLGSGRVTWSKLKLWNGCQLFQYLKHFWRIIKSVSKHSVSVLHFQGLLCVSLDYVFGTQTCVMGLFPAVRCEVRGLLFEMGLTLL
jgi:hypothetical protein